MPDSLQVDERRWTLRGQIHGLDTNESVDVVAASVVDVYRDAIREIGKAQTLHEVWAIVANGPLATAPGGLDEGECFRLREEVAARDETILTLHMQLKISQDGEEDRIGEIGRLEAEVARLTARVEEIQQRATILVDAMRDIRGNGAMPHDATRYAAAQREAEAALLAYEEAGGRREDEVEAAALAALVAARAQSAGYERGLKAARAKGARQERERLRDALMDDGRVAAVKKARAMQRGRATPCDPVALGDELVRAALAAVLSEEEGSGV